MKGILLRKTPKEQKRGTCRKALVVAALLLSFHPADAVVFPNGLSADSVSPEADSVAIAKMRRHLDGIRKSKHRPTVALVLSGGGAKGSAHIGVKKLLDEMRIPVDVICGTSMGGLMGGMMALGYDCEFLDSLLRNQNWGTTLTDKVDAKYIPYSTKKYKSTFFLSIPFHYKDEDFAERISEQERHFRGARQGTNSFLSSLPAGYVNGFNVNNFLSSLSVGYQDSLDFKNLPIPFFCVASDMVSCKAKNWSSGSINQALRSTMGIPGLFNPVRSNAMVLVDGGTRNNFPTDIANAMGADIIIGVDLSDERPTYSEVNSALDLVSQFITMLGNDSFQKNREGCDIFIKPNLSGFNMLSFSPEAVDTIINRGYQAALRHKDELQALKDSLGKDSEPYLNGRKATDIGRRFVKVSGIVFKGVSDKESRFLQRKIDLIAGQSVDASIVNDAMCKIQATGAFSAVTYSLLGTEEPYVLEFNCRKSPIHQFGLSFRADTEEYPSLALNLGLNTRSLIGSKLDLTGKFGLSSFIQAHYMLDLPYVPTINVKTSVSWIRPNLVSNGTSMTGNVKMFTHNGSIYFSNLNWTRCDIQAGIQSRMTDIRDNTPLGQIISVMYQPHSCYFGAFAKLSTYTLDNAYFPSRGHFLKIGADFDFAKYKDPGYRPVILLNADFKFVIPAADIFAIIPDLHYRGRFYNSPDREPSCFSFNHMITYGGMMEGRYSETQVPFIGFCDVRQSDKTNLALANIDFRFKVAKNFYASLIGGIAQEFNHLRELDNIKSSPRFFGAGAEIAYNSILGPLKFNVHWSDFNHRWQAYFSAGFDF